MPFALEFIATLATTLFCGAAIYINLVEHPARMGRGIQIAATVWAPSYKRATSLGSGYMDEEGVVSCPWLHLRCRGLAT